MKEMNIKSKIRKMKSRQKEKVQAAGYIYPNLLACDFNAFFPHYKWMMDVTEVMHEETKIYVSALMDLFNRGPVSFVISRNPNNEMMGETIRQAMESRGLKDLSQVLIHKNAAKNVWGIYHPKRSWPRIMNVPNYVISWCPLLGGLTTHHPVPKIGCIIYLDQNCYYPAY